MPEVLTKKKKKTCPVLPKTTPRILKPGLQTPPPPLESAIHALGHLILILGHILPASVAWFSALPLSPRAPAVKATDEAPYGWSLNGRVSRSSFSITSPQKQELGLSYQHCVPHSQSTCTAAPRQKALPSPRQTLRSHKEKVETKTLSLQQARQGEPKVTRGAGWAPTTFGPHQEARKRC